MIDMKFCIAALLAAALCFGLFSCTGEAQEPPAPADPTTTTATISASAATAEPTALSATTPGPATVPALPVPPQLFVSLGGAQRVRAAQLSNTWETPDGQGFSASAYHPLDFFGRDHCPDFIIVEHFIITHNGSGSEVALQFDGNLPPDAVQVQRWNAALATNEINMRAWNQYESVALSDNTFIVSESDNDYIYEVRATWSQEYQGYQFYTFRINNTR
jgi:hypothetical protein